MDRLLEAKKVFDTEITALEKTRDALDDTFLQVLDLVVNCKGKVIITGMGKPGHIAAKLAATFSSLGTPSFRLHPAEAMHGDLGMVSSNDIVIAISFSGESDEIIRILPNIKMIGATLVGITGNSNSTLAKASDVVQVLPKFEEACYLGLAPTSSTTAVLCYGDALAVVASGIYGFKDVDFGKFHPAGALGKKLIMTVDDLMVPNEGRHIISKSNTLMDAVLEMSRGVPGIVTIVDDADHLEGVITDGDLRRLLQKRCDIYSMRIDEVMTQKPITFNSGLLAVNALNIMKEKHIHNAPVVEGDKCIGIISVQRILQAGIVGEKMQ